MQCTTSPGETKCDHCKENELDCVFKNDDERKRYVIVPRKLSPFLLRNEDASLLNIVCGFLHDSILIMSRPRSKIFMHSLLEHIELLESHLKEVDGGVLQELHRPNSELDIQPTLQEEDAAPNVSSPWRRSRSPNEFDTTHLAFEDFDLPEDAGIYNPGGIEQQEQTPTSSAPSTNNGFISHSDVDSREELLQTTANARQSFIFDSAPLKYDLVTGQLQRCTPIARYQRYADQVTGSQRIHSGSWHLRQRLRRAIGDLDPETHDHLMTCFWTCYNSTMQIVDEMTFAQRKDENEDNPDYSGFLHICCLAMGFRFADKSRPDIKSLDKGDRQSTFHRDARFFVETELEILRGLTTVQGLLILSDLECAVGRDRASWMYAGKCQLLLSQ